jgi:hypothetical protein
MEAAHDFLFPFLPESQSKNPIEQDGATHCAKNKLFFQSPFFNMYLFPIDSLWQRSYSPGSARGREWELFFENLAVSTRGRLAIGSQQSNRIRGLNQQVKELRPRGHRPVELHFGQ